MLQPGDTILGLNLAHGGHLTHGHHLNFSGKTYRIVPYGVTKETETIDYDDLEKLAEKERPKLIIGGGSAYPRIIDFARMRQIADKVGALYLVDMAHFAGLVAGGVHPSPVPHAHIVTTTTHKTLRGPRAGMILSKQEFARCHRQGCVSRECRAARWFTSSPPKRSASWKRCSPNSESTRGRSWPTPKCWPKRWRPRASASFPEAPTLTSCWSMCSPRACSAARPRRRWARPRITVNKNAIPFDTNPPMKPSGIRIGTPALTTRGMKEEEMRQVGRWISEALHHRTEAAVLGKIRKQVLELAEAFPLYPERRAKAQAESKSRTRSRFH